MLTMKMMQDIFAALEKGETYNYSDGKTELSISPNGISIKYKDSKPVDNRDLEIKKFLQFCDCLNDDLFMEVCETFTEGELDKLQNDLDTDNYKNTITVFTNRVKEVAKEKLESICTEADKEIRKQEEIIKNAKAAIEAIHQQLEIEHKKYSVC